MQAVGWHREDIKAALRKQFGDLRSLGRSWGYRSHMVSFAITTDRSLTVERRISEALQVPLHELWPDRWNPDGTSRPRSRSKGKRSPRGPYGKRQKGNVA